MATMGKYCKAYALKKLREFGGWTERAERELSDDDYVYVQENYVVTDGIFKDEGIIFDDVSPERIAYCHEALGFEIPDYAGAGPV